MRRRWILSLAGIVVLAMGVTAVVFRSVRGNRAVSKAVERPPTATSPASKSLKPAVIETSPPPAVQESERRVVVNLPVIPQEDIDRECVGSLTISAASKSAMTLSSERPGDGVRIMAPVSLGPAGFTGGRMRATFCQGAGSEMRFLGKQFYTNVTLTADSETRLCFRKVKEGWAYVCGRGAVKYPAKPAPVDLGSSRTVDSCLATLNSTDALLREGCARELGQIGRAHV